MHNKFLAVSLMTVLFMNSAMSNETLGEPDANNNDNNKLRSNDPNYFVLAVPMHKGELEDDMHLEFYLSMKYPLLGSHNTQSLLFIYNGLYDFYIIESDRYKSAPIISRRQNPGLTGEYNNRKFGQIRLGYFHESNGQTLDGEDGKSAYDAEIAQRGEEYALTQVSRGWDYACLRYQINLDGDWKVSIEEDDQWLYRMGIEYRHFMSKQMFTFDKEDEIFWDPNNHSTIQDYDGLRSLIEARFFSHRLIPRLEMKWGTGSTDALCHFTYRASITVKPFEKQGLLLNLFYFDGYGKEPSTYHLRTDYAGIGFEFR